MGGVVASAAIVSLLGLPALSSGATVAKPHSLAPGTYTTGHWSITNTTHTATSTLAGITVTAHAANIPQLTKHGISTTSTPKLFTTGSTRTTTAPSYYPIAATTGTGLSQTVGCYLDNHYVKKATPTPLTETCAVITYTLSKPVSGLNFASLSGVSYIGGTTATLKVRSVMYATATITSNFKFAHKATNQSPNTKFSNDTRTIEPKTIPALGTPYATVGASTAGWNCADLGVCFNVKIDGGGPVTSFSITYKDYLYFGTRCTTYGATGHGFGTLTSTAFCNNVTVTATTSNSAIGKSYGTTLVDQIFATAELSFTVSAGGNYGGTNVAATPTGGFYIANANGTVTAHGTAPGLPQLATLHVNVTDITGIALDTCNTAGYWLVGADGGVFALGTTGFYGSLPLLHVDPVDPILAIATTNDCGGYWEIAKDGGVFAFGDATFFGSLPYTDIHATNIVGFAPTPDSGGYLIIGSDGGTFNFGDAKWFGSIDSVGAYANNIVGGTWADTGGYYLVGSNGGVYAFGDAAFKGSLGATNISVPIIGIIRGTGGYKLINSAGTVYTFPVA